MNFAISAEYTQKNFVSKDGTKINLNYQIVKESGVTNRPYNYIKVENLNFSLESIQLHESSTVRVIFINSMHDIPVCGRNLFDFEEIYYLDLEPRMNGRLIYEASFTTHAKRMESNQRAQDLYLLKRNYCRTVESKWQEIAIVVDGRWLVDPVSNSNNFVFKL